MTRTIQWWLIKLGVSSLILGLFLATQMMPVAAQYQQNTQIPRLTAVRSGTHLGYDRLVFEFAGQKLPESIHTWQLGPTTVRIVFYPAYSYGALPSIATNKIIQGVSSVGGEGGIAYDIRLSKMTHFTTFTLTGPTRYVIDFSQS